MACSGSSEGVRSGSGGTERIRVGHRRAESGAQQAADVAASRLFVHAGAGADAVHCLHPRAGRADDRRFIFLVRADIADLGVRRFRQLREGGERSGVLAVAPQQPHHRVRFDCHPDRVRHVARGNPRSRNPSRLDRLPHPHLRADGDLVGRRRPDLADDPRRV